jgi:hypothetical protein
MRSSLRIHSRTPGEIVAQLGPVVIRVVGGYETTEASILGLFDVIAEVLREHPVLAMLVVVEHGSPVPTGEVRRCIDEQLTNYADCVITGYAMLGLGFWAQQARDFAQDRTRLEGCTILVDIELARLVERLASELVGIDAEQLIEVAQQLRAELASAPPR